MIVECAISVIIPVYNVEQYLEKCVESVLNQTFQDIELILVDDGSSDSSSEICDRYQVLYNRVHVIHQPNTGAGIARNRGLEIAEGKYITFVDSDDYLERDILEKLYNTATVEKSDCVISGSTMIYSNGSMGLMPVVKGKKMFVDEEIVEVLLDSISAPPKCKLDSIYGQSVCGKLFKRQIVEDNKIRFVSEREYLSEDTLFNIAFLKYARKVIAVPDVSYHYNCAHVGSLSKEYREDRFEMELVLAHAVEEQLKDILPFNKYILYLQRFFIMRVAFDITQEVLYHDHVSKRHPMYENIRRILNNEKLRNELNEYPWRKLPFLRMILVGTMKYRMTRVLVLLIRVQQCVMNSCQNI